MSDIDFEAEARAMLGGGTCTCGKCLWCSGFSETVEILRSIAERSKPQWVSGETDPGEHGRYIVVLHRGPVIEWQEAIFDGWFTKEPGQGAWSRLVADEDGGRGFDRELLDGVVAWLDPSDIPLPALKKEPTDE